MKPVNAPDPAVTLSKASTIKDVATAWTKEDSAVNLHVNPMFSMPGVSVSGLPIPFHQNGEKFWGYTRSSR